MAEARSEGAGKVPNELAVAGSDSGAGAGMQAGSEVSAGPTSHPLTRWPGR